MNIVNDVWIHIAFHLCYIDLLSVTIALPHIRKYINKNSYDINYIIRKKLKYKLNGTIKVKQFLNNLQYYNNYISGSFILQCLYNYDWPESDIDVYCMSDQSFTSFQEHCFIGMYGGKNPLDFMNFLNEQHFDYIKSLFHYEELHLSQRMFKKDDVYINHIMVDPTPVTISNYGNNRLFELGKRLHHDTIFKFVDFTFDLEFCKVIYDGQKLYIKNLESLFKRECYINLELDKYIRKSFYGKDITDEELVTKLESRVDKYEKRGFKILRYLS